MDKKDIPLNMIAKKIREHKMESSVLAMFEKLTDAQAYLTMNKDLMIVLDIFNKATVLEIDKLKLPWSNIVACVDFKKPDDKEFYAMIHERGALCLFKANRGKIDKQYQDGDKIVYQTLINNGIDIIETNLTAQVYNNVVSKYTNKTSSKFRFIKIP